MGRERVEMGTWLNFNYRFSRSARRHRPVRFLSIKMFNFSAVQWHWISGDHWHFQAKLSFVTRLLSFTMGRKRTAHREKCKYCVCSAHRAAATANSKLKLPTFLGETKKKKKSRNNATVSFTIFRCYVSSIRMAQKFNLYFFYKLLSNSPRRRVEPESWRTKFSESRFFSIIQLSFFFFSSTRQLGPEHACLNENWH